MACDIEKSECKNKQNGIVKNEKQMCVRERVLRRYFLNFNIFFHGNDNYGKH